MKHLGAKAWLSVAALAVVMGLLLFVSAWTIHYWQAWVYLSIFTGTSILMTRDLMQRDRALPVPYGIVRHPMYASASLYLLGMPLALGSYWGLVIAAMMPFLIWRLLDEERLLAEKLPGYTEHRKRVRYRPVPLVW